MSERAILALPFVSGCSDKVDLWDVQETGDWALDNRLGHTMADALLSHMFARNNPPLLGRVVRAISAKGRFGGVEVGFFHCIAARTLQ